MTSTTSPQAVTFRSGFRTLTPYLLAESAEYLEFLAKVFGAVQTERTDTGPGRFHAEMKIGDSMIMIGVGAGRSMPIMLQLFAPKSEEVYDRAIVAGSKSVLPISEAYGERFGVVKDPAGNQWILSTHLSDDAFTQPPHSLMTWFHPRGAAKFIDFVKGAFNATELLRGDSPDGRVNYAQLQIGNSVIALNDPSEDWMPAESMVYLYVPNVHEVYQQAIVAGAKSLSEPKDQFYGDRSAGVQDEWGNMWYIATPRM